MTYIELLMLLKLKLNIIVQALVVVFFHRSDVLLLYLLLLAQSGNHGTLSLRRASTSRSCRYRARPLLREALALANAD